MKGLGTYKSEYEPAIQIMAGMRQQYDMLMSEFEASGCQYSETTENGSKKAPIVTTLEALRRDILAYMNALGFTPMGMKRLEGDKGQGGKKEEKDPLAALLEQIAADSS